ncbi:MAG: single-stranded-DNA-specific exonuclease RecJ [Verrucomicrobiales bacterium]
MFEAQEAEAEWILAPSPPAAEVAQLARSFGLDPLVVTVAMQRGFTTPETLERYLYPRLQDLADPFLLPDMEAAVDRLLHAVDHREEVLLYGDYDVDGVSSLALLKTTLAAYGLQPHCFLPHRIDEGYGLSHDGIERCLQMWQPTLVIAADCGTNSRSVADALRDKGIDLLVLDHHEPSPDGIADCVAVVNPKRGDTFHYLCTGGVVFKVAHALLKRRPLAGFALRDHLDLVALATVADIVPLVDENRIFVRRGLTQLDRTAHPGLSALKQVAGVNGPVRSHDIGFKLGPRLNASGRLDTAQVSLELLLTQDIIAAERLARELDAHNRERQTLEQQTREEAEEMIQYLSPTDRAHSIVVGSRGWHPGVVGIVAARILRRYHRPTFVIAIDDSGIGKGSGRSIHGVSLVDAIDHCCDLLEAGGGHEMAAGLSIREENITAFRERFNAHIARSSDPDLFRPRLLLSAETRLATLDLELLDSYELLHPFGNANSQPLLYAREVQVVGEPRILKDKHLKLRIVQQGSQPRDAMYFNGAGLDLPRPPWDIAFTIDRNEFRGRLNVGISIQQVRKSG